MSSMRIEAAADGLRHAIDKMPDGPTVSGPYFAQWSTIGRNRIKSWIADAEHALRWATDDIEEAEGKGPSAAKGLEEALWRLDVAHDRLVVVLALALGVPLVKLSKNRHGVQFHPERRKVLSKLGELGSSPTPSSAERLERAMRRWYEHPARTLRHQVTHSLSQTTSVQALIDLDVRYWRGSSESYRDAKLLYDNDIHVGSSDITAEAVWKRGLEQAHDGLQLLIECMEVSAEVVRDHAHLETPTVVNYDLDSGLARLPS
jgi:hypothetical protein